VFVLDAPTEDDLDICKNNGLLYTVVGSAGNRGKNRNTGLQYIVQHFNLSDDDIIEFFDGDRYIVRSNENALTVLFDQEHVDGVLYTCDNDARLTKYNVPMNGAMVLDTGTLCNPFYSCGFGIKYGAIKKIIEYNDGEFFVEIFNKWGCEDQFMGLVCDQLDLNIAITTEIQLNGNVGGDQHAHDDYKESLQHYVDLMLFRHIPFRNEAKPSRIIEMN
jgi:hypothetical protein